MKPFITLRHLVLVFSFLLAGSVVMAQDKEAELEMQKAMQAEEQLKKQEMMEKQKALQEEEMKARKDLLEEQRHRQREQMSQLEREYADQARVFERQAREYSRAEPFIVGSGWSEPQNTYFMSSFGQTSQSQLTLRKNFRGTTNTSKGEFDVESGISHFRCMISGSVKSGKIVIGVEYPDGKTFKELTINNSADINFSQSISVKKEEEKKYTGSWSYVIKAEKAEGNYMMQILTH
jgi:hypothetical protein